MNSLDYIKSIKHPFYSVQLKKKRGVCEACGYLSLFSFSDIITDQLAKEWGLNDKLKDAYSRRESMTCMQCGCSARCRALARAICLFFGFKKDLKTAISRGFLDELSIAEINACGNLHQILKEINGLVYSEYGSKDKKIPSEDLQELSYPSDVFDLVVSSETLEHIPDYKKALMEIRRILKPGGHHIFTVPLIFSRNNRVRAEIKNGQIKNKLNPSYHGTGNKDFMVYTEFGIDFMEDLNHIGFKTDIYFGNYLSKNEVNYVLVSRKV